MNTPVTTSAEDQDSKLAQTVDKATAGAHHKIDSASAASGPAVDRMVHNAHATVDSIGGLATHAVEALDLKGEQLTKAKNQVIKATDDYVHAHPIVSIGLAVAAGYLISRALSSR